MKVLNSITSLLITLIYLSRSTVYGTSIWDKYLPSSLSNIWKLKDLMSFSNNSPIGDILSHFVERFREGLIEANGKDLYFPDFEWIIDLPSLHGIIRTFDMNMSGLPEFKLNNLTTDILNGTADLDVEFPVINLHGSFQLVGMKCLGIPLWGDGKFSIKLVLLDFRLGGRLSDPTAPISVSHPQISLQNIVISAEGFLSDLQFWHLLLAVGFLWVVTSAFAVLITLYCIGVETKLTKRFSKYKTVP